MGISWTVRILQLSVRCFTTGEWTITVDLFTPFSSLPEVTVHGSDIRVVSHRWDCVLCKRSCFSIPRWNDDHNLCAFFISQSTFSSPSSSTGKRKDDDRGLDDLLPFSRYTLIDPNSDEERLMDGFVSISMNQHKEICGIHMGGRLGLKKEQLDICKKLAFNKVLELTDRIRQVVADYYQ